MKKVILMVATALFIASCSKNQKNEGSKTDVQEDVASESQKDETSKTETVSIEHEVSSRESNTPNSLNEEVNNKLEWTGVNSRDEVRQKMNGTIWETVEKDNYSGRWLRFVINGNYVEQYHAGSTLNYDDMKDWKPLYKWEIYDIYEPEKGTYVMALKEVEDRFPYTFIFLRENVVAFEWGEDNAGAQLHLVSR